MKMDTGKWITRVEIAAITLGLTVVAPARIMALVMSSLSVTPTPEPPAVERPLVIRLI